MRRLDLDVVGITETWEGRCQVQSLAGYTFIGKARQHTTGGGVGFYVSRALAPIVRAYTNTALPESIWLEVNNRRQQARPLYIGLAYIPPCHLTTNAAIEEAYTALRADIDRFQQQGEVMVMGDFNSRVGTAPTTGQHIGEWGEAMPADRAGTALINLLHATNLYLLNNRRPNPDPANHTPVYTRRRLVTLEDDVREQCSMLDYVMMPQRYVLPSPPSVQPPSSLHVETNTRFTGADHLLMWFVLPHPVSKTRPPSFCQPRPNTHKLTLPTTAITEQDKAEREAYPKAIEENFADFGDLLTRLQEQAEQGTLSAHDACEQAKKEACNRIFAAVDATIGFKRPRRHPCNRNHPVHTAEVKTAVQRRDDAASTLAHIGTQPETDQAALQTARQALKSAQQALKATVGIARQARINRLISSVYSCRIGNDGKGMWAALKALAGNKREGHAGPQALKHPSGSGLVTSDQDICTTLANHYEKVSSSSAHYQASEFDQTHRAHIEAQVNNYRQNMSYEDEGPAGLSDAITPTEVHLQCSMLSNNKAPSPLDNVNNELLKYGGDALYTAMAGFFNMQFALETKAKTCGVITPIYKKDDPTEPKNYRPITLGSAIDKLYNLVLNARIMDYLEQNGRLHDAQQGFRPGRSAVDNIFMLRTCLDARMQQKLDTYLLFVDIDKAYDTVWRAGLLWHIWQKGIRGKMFRVLAQMLDHTPSTVLHNGAFSELIEPDMGWEQGDTLATTMFNIYIDSVLQHVWQVHPGVSIPTNTEEHAKLVALMYADDLVGLADSANNLQSLANETRTALTKWQLKASVSPVDTSKTAVMVIKGGPRSARIHASRYGSGSTHNFTWGSTTIPQVKTYRYLGAWVTNVGTWDEHMQQRTKKANLVAAIHHKVLTQTRLPPHVRKLTLTTIIQPVLTYAAQVWARPQLRQQLDSWQMSIATRAFHCPPTTSHICMQQELGLFPLHVTCETLAIRYWHHLQRVPTDRLLHQVTSAWSGKYNPWASNMSKLLAQYEIDTQLGPTLNADQFKTYVDKQAIAYLKKYWTQPPRKYSGPVHTRYTASFGIGKLTTTRPKLRKYLAQPFHTDPNHLAKGTELCMQMRLECLPLKAFHSHRRRQETIEAQRSRELCPGCRQTSETPTHFLFECPAYASPRSIYLADAIAGTHSSTQDARLSAPDLGATLAPHPSPQPATAHADPAIHAHAALALEAAPATAPQAHAGANTMDAWRQVMKMECAGVEAYMVHSWRIRRAALTGREANGGDSMALTPVPELSAHI
jgi:hypothetical protein